MVFTTRDSSNIAALPGKKNLVKITEGGGNEPAEKRRGSWQLAVDGTNRDTISIGETLYDWDLSEWVKYGSRRCPRS
jgi:hypothetical protein